MTGDGTTVHYLQHTPSVDPLRSSCGRPIRSTALSRSLRSSVSFTRRDQLIKLGVDAHRLLAVRPTVLLERLALDVWVCISSCSVVPSDTCLSSVPQPTVRTSMLRVSCRTRTLHLSPREHNWKRLLLFASIPTETDCWVKAVMRASPQLTRSRPWIL